MRVLRVINRAGQLLRSLMEDFISIIDIDLNNFIILGQQVSPGI